MSDPHLAERPEKKTAGPPSVEHYFRNIIVLNQALSEGGEAFRDSHASTVGTERAEDHTILWLGCNVLRTPHLAQLAASVMRLVNPDLSILGGPSHCCGSPMPDKSDRERTLARTIGHFQAERVPTLVSWCPSCHTNLRNGSDSASWGFEELHITEFIAERLDRIKFEPRITARVMLHGHTGEPDRDKDMQYCRRLLEAIPGITIVAEHSDADLGLHCVPILLAPRIGMEGFDRKVNALLEAARDVGADMLVTIYHSCYREIEKRCGPYASTVENYITLLAKALNLPVPANVYREIARGGGARIERLVCDAEARSVDRAELENAARAEFPVLASNR